MGAHQATAGLPVTEPWITPVAAAQQKVLLPVTPSEAPTHHPTKAGESVHSEQMKFVVTTKGVTFRETEIVWELPTESSWLSSGIREKNDVPEFTTRAVGVFLLILTFVVMVFVFWNAFRWTGNFATEHTRTEDIPLHMFIPNYPPFLSDRNASAERLLSRLLKRAYKRTAAFPTSELQTAERSPRTLTPEPPTTGSAGETTSVHPSKVAVNGEIEEII